MVWYSHFFQNSPQFIVIHTVKGFGIVNKAEIVESLEIIHALVINSFMANMARIHNRERIISSVSGLVKIR